MSVTTTLGTNLKKLRIKNNYTQNDIADYLNLSRQAISQWENGKSTPDLDTLLLLAKLYNISINELLNSNTQNSTYQSVKTSSDDKSTVFEIIGISVILVLSVQFPFASILIPVFIIFWLRKSQRKYIVVYILCIICLVVGIYNTYVFFIHFFTNSGISVIKKI